MTNKHRIRLTGLLYSEAQLLLVEQMNPHTGLKRWATPGGGLELSDPDIFKGVEREVWEETGIPVKAGAIRFVNEFFDQYSQTLMLDIWIECHPAEGSTFGPISLDNVRVDDYITAVRWWPKEAFLTTNHRASAQLLHPELWNYLETNNRDVLHLGRWED